MPAQVSILQAQGGLRSLNDREQPAKGQKHRSMIVADETVSPVITDLSGPPSDFALGRVEDGRGSLGHSATLRFPSPLWKAPPGHGARQQPTSGRSRRVGVSQTSWSPILIDASADRHFNPGHGMVNRFMTAQSTVAMRRWGFPRRCDARGDGRTGGAARRRRGETVCGRSCWLSARQRAAARA